MAIWDNWSTVKKTRAAVGLLLLVGVVLYALIMDFMGWQR